jgi:NADP-dependent 3-hydroxy acid dehydrogenase YdfG
VSDHSGRFDVLVANAGVAKFVPIDDYPEDLFDEVCNRRPPSVPALNSFHWRSR